MPARRSIPGDMRRGRSRCAAVGAFAIPLCAAVVAAAPVVPDRLPPRVNSAWVYDPQPRQAGGTLEAGRFAKSLHDYNARARGSHRIGALYVYAGDMEMYCPGHRPRRCRPRDMHVYYAADGSAPGEAGNASVAAYARSAGRASAPALQIPVIDGSISPGGTLPGFDRLEPAQARAFADKAARKICADARADGVQFDLEPFDVSRRGGQYHFYLRIAKDFASRKQGCVDASHPRGRFFAIFTSARRLRPGSDGARNVQDIMHLAGNGYLIDALYDLAGAPAGERTPVDRYARVAAREAARMREWAGELQVPYQYGVPAAAAAHEYTACRGTHCRPGGKGPASQLAYVRAALGAVDASGARTDPLFLGVALWAWGPAVRVHGMEFLPARPPEDVLRYLRGAL